MISLPDSRAWARAPDLEPVPKLADGLVIDGGDDRLAVRVDLPNGLLQLRVENVPVGHDYDGVEELLVVHLEPSHAVCGPRDGVGLAGACRVLDEEPTVEVRGSHGSLKLLHDVPLVEAREDQRVRMPLPSSLVLGAGLGDPDVARQNREPGIALQHLLPEVRGPLPIRV